jgi:uncharacterized protein YbdZ (MbtH family)
MGHTTPDCERTYMVVQNTEEECSIWRAIIPAGREAAPKTGTLDECLTYISEISTISELSEQMQPLRPCHLTGYLA